MNTIIKFSVFLIGALVIFSSCEKDDSKEFEAAKGEIAILASIPNPDGQSGSTYLQLIGDLTPKTYENLTAFPFTLTDQIVMRGEDIYVMSFTGSDVVKKYTRNANKELSLSGQLIVGANSAVTAIAIQSENKAYLSLTGKGKIWIFNPSTMTKTGEIDLTSYGVGDQNPDPAQLLIRDNKLYVALNQMVGGYYSAQNRPYTDLVIVDTETNKVEKMITQNTAGFSQPTRPFDDKQMFMDENKDIYIVCASGFGFVVGHKAGILRIKNGETELDANYAFNLGDTDITGESNSLSWLPYVQYGGNGKLYGQADIPAYYSNPPNFIEDKSVIPVEIDLYAQTIKKLDLPRSNNYGSVGIYNDKIIFGLSSINESGFYTYDLNTQEASSNALVKTTGFPALFRHFGEEY